MHVDYFFEAMGSLGPHPYKRVGILAKSEIESIAVRIAAQMIRLYGGVPVLGRLFVMHVASTLGFMDGIKRSI